MDRETKKYLKILSSGKKGMYSPEKLLEINATYSLCIGERSNGKTFAYLLYALWRYFNYNEQFCYVRRWSRDFQGANSGRNVFDTLINSTGNFIEIVSNNKYSKIEYYGGRYYLLNSDGKRETVIGYGLILSENEKYKSTSYNFVTTVIFDEFITRTQYLNNEFVLFQNLLSTIIRDRTNVSIFMLANTVNQYGCPYFNEMLLKNIKNQQQGTIDKYEYDNSDCTVAVEYCASIGVSKESKKYYNAFENPQLKTIYSGVWEIASYPHLDVKYKSTNITARFFINYSGELIEGELIVLDDGNSFIFFHPKTSEIKDDNAIIYTDGVSYKANIISSFLHTPNRLTKLIYKLYCLNKVFYSSNDVGEIVYSYVTHCKGR